MKTQELQRGPCKVCGCTNYELSMGGSEICPACDCGISVAEVELARLKGLLSRAGEVLALYADYPIAMPISVTLRQRTRAIIAEVRKAL